MLNLKEIFNRSQNKIFKTIKFDHDQLYDIFVNMKILAKKIAAYGLIYSSLAITFLFTVGGAVFCIPPISQFFGLGFVPMVILGSFCTIAAFWGTYVVYGVCLNDMVLKLAGLDSKAEFVNELNGPSQIKKPGIAKHVLIVSIILFNAIFYIAGNYFAMLSLLPILNLGGSSLAIAISLILSVINYIPTFALNGMSLINAELGYGKSMEPKLLGPNNSNTSILVEQERQSVIAYQSASSGFIPRSHPREINEIVSSAPVVLNRTRAASCPPRLLCP